MSRSSRFAIGLLLIAATLPMVGLADEPKPPELTSEEQKLAAEAKQLSRDAFPSYQAGRYQEAVAKLRQALGICQRLYPAAKYPDGHPDLSGSLNNLGRVLMAMGQREEAFGCFEQSLEMIRKLYPASKFPNGHTDLASSLSSMGGVLQEMGQVEKALPCYEQSLAMYRKLFPESKYPDGNQNVVASLNNLASLLQTMGQPDKALSYAEQTLVMARRLYPESNYPDGHPQLARCISNVGMLLHEMGSSKRALAYVEQALAMRRKLYPVSKYADGHPELAINLNGMGFLLNAQGLPVMAKPYYEQALAMYQAFYHPSMYPDGHPDIARLLSNLGNVSNALGEAEPALSYHEQSLAMNRKQYPVTKYADGHPILALNLNDVGFTLAAMSHAEKALPSLKHALEMQHKLFQRELVTASEAAALDLIAHWRLGTIHLYYSAAVQLPLTGADSYQAAWDAKGAVQRVLARRHLAANVQRQQSPEVHRQYERLGQVQREIGRLVNNPGRVVAARDERLRELSDERDSLERALARLLPALERDNQLARLSPADLQPILPAHTVLIDMIRYTHWVKGKVTGQRYLAFLLAAQTQSSPSPLPPSGGEGSIRRVELGDATQIDRAIQEWRTAIESRSATLAAERLRELVWTKLAPHLPAGTKTLYLSPDSDLARMPWAALPIGEDRVLLEDYVLAMVSHGAFVLEAFKYPREYEGPGSALLLGGVDYNSKTWPDLPGAATELTALTGLAPTPPTTLAKSDATPKRLTEVLSKARYAHFATHGYFDAERLVAEQERASKAMESRRFGVDSRNLAAKNPLGFVGLVLANGEVLSGLSIVDLPLENLRLVTLSACETGLGECTGGEGVQGLQRAFHLAGCPNVVASLWKVNDAATAALMTKFYHEMWVNKKPPIEALREAQLTIYRRPDLIPALAAERGLKLEQALNAKSAPPSESKGTTLTKLWAAFVLSGVGR